MDVMMQKEECPKVTFTPPLYKQRYQFIKQLVSKHKPKKVFAFAAKIADLGCADCKLLWMLKFCNCIEVLVGLDISEDVMKEKMHTLSPLPGDYLQPSERSLTIILYQGSVAVKDPCMLGFDMITCIELIEHLEANVLEKFEEVVFGFMSPTMIIISTPNSEFNPLLQIVTLFRHPDHKFEWNRSQFQNWAQETAARYDYTVQFTGLGIPPPGKDVGFCTQIGVFVRKFIKHVEVTQSEKYQDRVYKINIHISTMDITTDLRGIVGTEAIDNNLNWSHLAIPKSMILVLFLDPILAPISPYCVFRFVSHSSTQWSKAPIPSIAVPKVSTVLRSPEHKTLLALTVHQLNWKAPLVQTAWQQEQDTTCILSYYMLGLQESTCSFSPSSISTCYSSDSSDEDKVFKAVYPSLKEEKYLQNAVINEVVWTAQLIARGLLNHQKSEYKKHCDDTVETESRFKPPNSFLKYMEYPSVLEPDNKNMQAFINGNTVSIPLAKIFSFPKVRQLCGNFETLSKFITGKIALSSDGAAVLIDTGYENEEDND
ncbi:hypothetical protein JD844_017467 [Phrynosoma platyrhinos]|uniref:Small RNA 2'-O-methyltransferase n=1 Tax=Phrynosoma platyrhinos TaxID=52577 RepID=A0ABQ7SM33_PHRPL|nr:hypothetical protein JD844_017467 [Phrynosoma platyrhinos]